MNFKNTFVNLPDSFYQKVNPELFVKPKLIRFNFELAKSLGIDTNNTSDDELAQVFSGQKILPGSEPIATVYAAHQFGHFVAQLGDGRAHLLGEIQSFDIQLKGSGRTQFSRNGDGRSALGPVLREYIVSEAMNSLGVKTSRALCAVSTGENVNRQFGEEPGGIFTRVADSHIRVGSFQYFANLGDTESLKILLDYSIKRHYPELVNTKGQEQKIIGFLKAFIEKQAKLIASWYSVGFIHGVMNTDNFSIAGITIDYGPCAFMDHFEFNKVFSSIDRNSRYSFANQVSIAQWNILRLAESLLSLINDDQKKAVGIIEEQIIPHLEIISEYRWAALAKKIGINNYIPEDQILIESFLAYLENESLDFTLSFRYIQQLHDGDFSHYPITDELTNFLKAWKLRLPDLSNTNKVNPLYIPRNHQIEKAIRLAYEGDYSLFHLLVDALKNPYQYQEPYDFLKQPPKKEEIVGATYCGT